jgi:5-methylcytosine-specific restriction enzyme A
VSWGFEEGRVYNRRTDIHAKFGGQQQGRIITPSQHPLVIIITGEEGQAHGYDDRTRADGVFEYFGEGQVGDMALQRGNLAIASHAADGKGLLLFRKTKEGLRFVGEMVYEKHHIELALDREGKQRDAIVFVAVWISIVPSTLASKCATSRSTYKFFASVSKTSVQRSA